MLQLILMIDPRLSMKSKTDAMIRIYLFRISLVVQSSDWLIMSSMKKVTESINYQPKIPWVAVAVVVIVILLVSLESFTMMRIFS